MTPRRAFLAVLPATLALDLVGLGFLHRHGFAQPLLLGRFVICLAAGYAAARGPRVGGAIGAAVGATLLATVLSLVVYIVTGAAVADQLGPAKVFILLLYAVPAATAGCLLGAATASTLRHAREA